MTHEQFEQESVHAVQWMLAIHRLYLETGRDPVSPRRQG